jgi:hypothetical protein
MEKWSQPILLYYYIIYLKGVDNGKSRKTENLTKVSPNQNSCQVQPQYLSDVAMENNSINTVAK